MQKDKSGHCASEACGSLTRADYSAPLQRKCTQRAQPAPGRCPISGFPRTNQAYWGRLCRPHTRSSFCQKVLSHFHTRGADTQIPVYLISLKTTVQLLGSETTFISGPGNICHMRGSNHAWLLRRSDTQTNGAKLVTQVVSSSLCEYRQ